MVILIQIIITMIIIIIFLIGKINFVNDINQIQSTRNIALKEARELSERGTIQTEQQTQAPKNVVKKTTKIRIPKQTSSHFHYITFHSATPLSINDNN